ncbi:MAG: hypothetical protein KAY37_08505 [Phycisphaerae bacterium]|nr:hypothetical protein [Phycisphaerae bacterium]
MRTMLGIIVVCGSLWLGTGCEKRGRDVTVMPAPHELPPLEYVRRSPHQGEVKVIGRVEEPVVALVPSFEEPELTPEERAAVGEDGPEYKPLLFNDLVWTPSTSVGDWYGGINTYASGLGGADTIHESMVTQRYHVSGWGGAAIGIGANVPLPGHTYRPDWRFRAVGPAGGLSVGIGRASEIAKHEERRRED